MAYLGGKYKIRHQVAEYINGLSPRVYLEAFCGYAWPGERVRAKQRYFSDMNQDLILMWQALQNGWVPPAVVSEDEYTALKNETTPSAMRGFVGTACSIFGVWFGTYARDPKKHTNYAAIGSRQFLRRIPCFNGAKFTFRDYRTAMDSVDADVIYCDPPYENTSTYAAVESFDSAAFWEEVRRRSDGKRRILVSEYSAPADFTVVMTAYSRMGLRTKSAAGLTNELRTERLYEYQPPKGRSQISFGSFLE